MESCRKTQNSLGWIAIEEWRIDSIGISMWLCFMEGTKTSESP